MGSCQIYFQKFKNKFSRWKNNFWRYINVERVSLNGYRSFVSGSIIMRQLNMMLGDYTKEALKSVSKTEKKIIIDSAEQTLHHEFDLLGSGLVRLDPIDWHIDFKSGAKWDRSFYLDLNTPKEADIKVPWELSRCQHLLWLGEAWLLTGEAKYAQEVVDEINWWIEDNPLMYSVNWRCAMDVAFRAVNWMHALNMIAGFEGLTALFEEKVAKSLWQHAFFIRNNLEKLIPYSNNHYASDIVGLLYLGKLFSHTQQGEYWFRFALQEFYIEVRKQLLDSGVHYEKSLSYHRLVTELFSYPLYMLQRTNETVPEDVRERICKMYTFIATYTKANGLAPLIGDNDDGRFVPFVKRDFRDHNYLNDPFSLENCFISIGLQSSFCSTSQQSCLYSDAGMAVIRRKDNYLFVNNNGYSKRPKETDLYIGTHTHNDLLSFEFSMAGHDIIIDPGTYLYTSNKRMRNEFRSTSKHNTLVVDGEEQNILPEDRMFYVRRNVNIKPLGVVENGIKGSYTTINGGMTHERTFFLRESSLLINDRLIKNGDGHIAVLSFYLAEEIEYGKDLTIQSSTGSLYVEECTWSPSYGILKKTHRVTICCEFDHHLDITTAIIPHLS